MGHPAISPRGSFVELVGSQAERIRFPQAAHWRIQFLNEAFGDCSLESEPEHAIATGRVQDAKICRGEKNGLFWLFGVGIFTNSKAFRKVQKKREELRFLNREGFSLNENTPLIISVLCYRATGTILYFAASLNPTLGTVTATRSYATASNLSVEAVEKYLITLEAEFLTGLCSVK